MYQIEAKHANIVNIEKSMQNFASFLDYYKAGLHAHFLMK
jgi:hypothetical protein